MGWLAVGPPDSSVSSDDGAYALAAEARADGWAVAHALADVDPEAEAYPYVNSEVSSKGVFPYVRRPPWVVALSYARALGGTWGLHVLPVVGAAVAAVVAGLLAVAVERAAAAPLAAGLAALSPLAYHGAQLWAHAVAAAGIGLAIAASELGRRRPAWFAVAAVAASAAASVRSEAALFGLGAAAVVAASGVRTRSGPLVAAGVALGAAVATTHLLVGRWASAILGTGGAGSAVDSRGGSGLAGRFEGGVQTLLLDDLGGRPVGYVLALVSFLLVGLALQRVRAGQPREAAAVLAAAAACWLVRPLLAPRQLVSGLLCAWPVALLAVAAPWARRSPGERRAVAAVALGTLAVLATQYDQGGGVNWGGRFLAPAIPVLAVVVAVAVRDVAEHAGARAVPVAAIGLAAAVTVSMVAADLSIRRLHDQMAGAVEAAQPTVPVVTAERALPRLAWRSHPEVQWLRIPDEGGAARLLELLRAGGVREVVVYRLPAEDVAVLTGRPAARVDAEVPTVVRLGRG